MRASALLVVLVCLVGCAGEAPRPVTLDFEKDEAGKVPAAFSVGVTGGGGEAAWVVSEDETARSGRKVLLQASADPTSDRLPVCVYEGIVTRDLRATVKLRIDSGTVDQAGGLVFRFSPENYYTVRASALENKVAIWKTVRAKGSLVVDASVKVTAGEWHELGVEVRGSHMNVTWDGRLVLVGEDRTFTVGKVGVSTRADSVVAFDDLRIEPLETN